MNLPRKRNEIKVHFLKKGTLQDVFLIFYKTEGRTEEFLTGPVFIKEGLNRFAALFARQNTEIPLERPSERVRALVADHGGDFIDIAGAFIQQALRLVHAHLLDIGGEADAHVILDEFGKIPFGQLEFFGHHVERQVGIAIIRFDKTAYGMDEFGASFLMAVPGKAGKPVADTDDGVPYIGRLTVRIDVLKFLGQDIFS